VSFVDAAVEDGIAARGTGIPFLPSRHRQLIGADATAPVIDDLQQVTSLLWRFRCEFQSSRTCSYARAKLFRMQA